MTAPLSGDTVSGNAVTVSATANDNVGVAGVQFLLDGANLGGEDTAAPYTMAWDTTTIANGTHTLSARARDAAGNATTSAGAPVTVSNPPTLLITQPAEGAMVVGATVQVAYATSGDLTEVDHVHFQLDGNPVVMDMTLDGVYQFANVPAGDHVMNGSLVRVDHSQIVGSEDSVSFSTSVPDTTPPSSPSGVTATAVSSTQINVS